MNRTTSQSISRHCKARWLLSGGMLLLVAAQSGCSLWQPTKQTPGEIYRQKQQEAGVPQTTGEFLKMQRIQPGEFKQ